MYIKTILVPVDFSEHNRWALDFAVALAKDANAKLIIVHVQDEPIRFAGGDGLALADLRLRTRALDHKLNQTLPVSTDVVVEHQLLTGVPAIEIVRFAEQHAVDVIIMNSHGRKGLIHLLLGSVAENVIRNAPCPVITVKGSAGSNPSTVRFRKDLLPH